MDFDQVTSDEETREDSAATPDAVEQSRLFDLLGRINYVILRGDGVYLQVGGTAYKVLYGVYWQSVFSGEQHWGLRCVEIERVWAEGAAAPRTELPLRYTKGGWVVEAASLQCPLYGDLLSLCDSADFLCSMPRRINLPED